MSIDRDTRRPVLALCGPVRSTGTPKGASLVVKDTEAWGPKFLPILFRGFLLIIVV